MKNNRADRFVEDGSYITISPSKQKRAKARLEETKIYENDPDEKEITARIQKELKSYRSYEMKYFKTKTREFKPNVLPPYIHYAMIDALDECKTYDAIDKAFKDIWDNPFVKSISRYQGKLRVDSTALWRGTVAPSEFTREMTAEVKRSLTRAFFSGVKEGGMTSDDLTKDELKQLDNLIAEEQQHVPELTKFISDNNKERGGRLNVVRSRVDRWLSRYANVKEVGFLIASRNKSMMWLYDSRKQNCVDCAKLHKRVYKASIWHKNNIAPQSNLLACFGLWCGCRFEETEEPVNQGRPPKLVGPK